MTYSFSTACIARIRKKGDVLVSASPSDSVFQQPEYGSVRSTPLHQTQASNHDSVQPPGSVKLTKCQTHADALRPQAHDALAVIVCP